MGFGRSRGICVVEPAVFNSSLKFSVPSGSECPHIRAATVVHTNALLNLILAAVLVALSGCGPSPGGSANAQSPKDQDGQITQLKEKLWAAIREKNAQKFLDCFFIEERFNTPDVRETNRKQVESTWTRDHCDRRRRNFGQRPVGDQQDPECQTRHGAALQFTSQKDDPAAPKERRWQGRQALPDRRAQWPMAHRHHGGIRYVECLA